MTDENKKPILEVYDPSEEVEKAIANLKKHQKIIYGIMTAVGIVVMVGFITIIIAAFAIFTDHQDYAAQKYQQYIDLIEKQPQINEEDETATETQITEMIEEVNLQKTSEKKENDTPPAIKKE